MTGVSTGSLHRDVSTRRLDMGGIVHLATVDFCSLSILGIALIAVLGSITRRSAEDWRYQLQVVRALTAVASDECATQPFELFEIQLVGNAPSAGSRSIAFSSIGRPQDVGVLLLDAPLAGMADRCRVWRDARTPLLCSGDSLGHAVVHGPDGFLEGQVTRRGDPPLLDSELTW